MALAPIVFDSSNRFEPLGRWLPSAQSNPKMSIVRYEAVVFRKHGPTIPAILALATDEQPHHVFWDRL